MKDFAHSDDPAVQRQLDRLAALSVPDGRLGLETIRALLGALGDPQDRLPPVFHIAGTNGKGSVSAFLRAILEADGYRVHATTSPHLVRYNERIRLAGDLISDRALAALLEEVLDSGEAFAPSFFEVTIAAALLAFTREPSDACVIEVGLGGRFDATNVIAHPAVCGIASLGLDHERFLLAPEAGAPADPMARIAFEKAGIAKPGAPLVTQTYPQPASDEIIRRAGLVRANLHMHRHDWWAETGRSSIAYRDRHGRLDLPLPALPGAHQAQNAALAVAMVRHQDAVSVSHAALAAGIRAARWPARLQWLAPGPLTELVPGRSILLDGGHNPDAAAALARFLTGLDEPVHAVIGMLANKDAAGFLGPLAPCLASLAAVPVSGHDHAATRSLATLAKDRGVPRVGEAPDLPSAIEKIGSGSGTVFIGGSLYLAGAALAANREYPD